MQSKYRYEIIICWSEEDEAYIAEVPELSGCAADGRRYQEALAQAEIVIGEWIETAKELGDRFPNLAAVCCSRSLATARRLQEIVAEHGWPIEKIVGADGAEAAWLILQHAIGDPDLQRRYLPVLQAAAQRGEIPAWQPVYLFDRILYFEGKPQV